MTAWSLDHTPASPFFIKLRLYTVTVIIVGMHVPFRLPSPRPAWRAGPMSSPRGGTSVLRSVARQRQASMMVCVKCSCCATSLYSRNGLRQPAFACSLSPLEREGCVTVFTLLGFYDCAMLCLARTVCYRKMSVCPSVRHTPVFCQNG